MPRRLRPLALAAALLLPTAALAAPPADWATRVEPALARARAEHKLVLVDLYASWCGWCKELDRQVFSTPRFRAYARQFVLLRVDTEDGGEGAELAARFAAESLPTTLIVTPQLSLAGQIEGFLPTERYIAAIDAELADYRAYQRRVERDARTTDPAALRRLAEEAHRRLDGAPAAQLYRRVLASSGVQPAERPLLTYLLADALRLDRDFAGASTALAAARAAAQREHDAELVERADLLAFSIAHEAGDCRRAKLSLEEFLQKHPQSSMSAQAQRALQALAADKSARCT